MNYFISDLHLGHKNCLKFDNRPFNTIEEQDDFIIKNWNKTITNLDDVYILGDISWYNTNKTIDIFSKLNGRLHLIKGNHDSKLLKNKSVRELFVEICDYRELYINNKTAIVLSHYPINFYKNHNHGWYHLYGHVHNSKEWELAMEMGDKVKALFPEASYNMYNVGCMMNYIGYIPKTLDEIIQRGNCELPTT